MLELQYWLDPCQEVKRVCSCWDEQEKPEIVHQGALSVFVVTGGLKVDPCPSQNPGVIEKSKMCFSWI